MSSTSRRICVIRWRCPRRIGVAGQRDVDALLRQAPVELGPRQLRLARVDRCLEPLAERVQRHPRLAVAHLAQRVLELALPAEVLDADLLDLVGRRGRLGSCEGCVLECLGVHGSAEVTNGSRRFDRACTARCTLYLGAVSGHDMDVSS